MNFKELSLFCIILRQIQYVFESLLFVLLRHLTRQTAVHQIKVCHLGILGKDKYLFETLPTKASTNVTSNELASNTFNI